MKLNKNKIIVSALALVIGTSLAGSVTGTLAWYQYSTRANVSFIGQSSGFSGNLQMRFSDEGDDAWRTRITWQEMAAELANNHYAKEVVPMTFGAMEKDSALPVDTAATPAPLGYIQPIAGVKDMNKWSRATKDNYAQFELQLRYVEHDGVNDGNAVKDVYLSKLVIQEDASNETNGKEDLSDAVRLHIASSYKEEVVENNQSSMVSKKPNKLISNLGGRINTSGLLDLDGDGHADRAYPDTDEFGFKDENGETLQAITYGSGSQDSYANSENFVAGTKWSDADLTAAAEVADAYGKSVDDWKTAPVYWTQPEIDAAAQDTEAPAHGKTVDDIKTPGVHWTQEEIDLANAAHEKTTADWKIDPVHPVKVSSNNNKIENLDYDDDGDELTVGPDETPTPRLSKLIGKTMEADDDFLTVTVTIWVEGWQKLDGSAIWDAKDYIGSKFNVGIQFAVQDAFAE